MTTVLGNARPRLTTLLAGSAIGVYMLVVIGATVTLTDAANSCAGWPLCSVGRSADPLVWVALGHRAIAAIVGAFLLGAGVLAWRTGAPRRVKAALAVPLVCYPVQVGIGALAATGDIAWVPTVHLAFGMVIFAGVVVSLGWSLEANGAALETEHRGTDPDDRSSAGVPDAGTEAGSRAATTALGPEPDPGTDLATGETTDRTAAEHTASEDPKRSPGGLKRTIGAYFSLMKPRLMWLLCLVAAAGMALAAGPALETRTVVLTLLGGVLSIGASGTFNHVLERDVDREMNRTADRPLAVDEVSVTNALVFGFGLALASLWVFSRVNLLVAVLGFVSIGFYSVIYTLVLKPNTVQNTVLGGAAGALPALIGWAAVTDGIGLPGLVLAAVIFCWTPAHFYNLALAYKDDYERGGFPMLPVVRGERVTRRHILWYLGLTLLAAVVLAAVSQLGWVYASATVLLGGVFLYTVVRLHRERTTGAAFRAFHASNAYLGAVLIAIVVDALVL